jgi:hypothetical protein
LPFVSRLAPEERARLLGNGDLLRYYAELPERPLRLEQDAVPDFGGRIVVARPGGTTAVVSGNGSSNGSGNGNGKHGAPPNRAVAAARRAWETSPQATMRRLRRAIGRTPQTNRAPDG